MSKQQDETAAAKASDPGTKSKGTDKPVPSSPASPPRRSSQHADQKSLPTAGGTERPRPNNSEAPGYALGGLRWPD